MAAGGGGKASESSSTVTEQAAMKRALELAVKGWGRVAPNPLVGAVLLRDGEVVGEGYHAEFGQAHAEVMALADCSDPRGTTCVVTLEPCCHEGKTAPCTEALIAAGVERVVAAINDPTPEAAGGMRRLADAGVDVSVGLCRESAAALNAPFLFNASRPSPSPSPSSSASSYRPFVAVKLASSLDGLLADESGNSQWISGPESRDYVHWLRAGFGAIGVGRITAVVDDPLLTVRGPLQPRVSPTRVVLSRSGELPDDLRMFDTEVAPAVIVAARSRVAELSEVFVNKGVTVLGADDLEEAMRCLREAGIASILIEGGGSLASSLLDADLVDRLYWIQAPRWLGRGTPAFQRLEGVLLESAESWPVTERRALGDDTLLVVDRRLCLQG